MLTMITLFKADTPVFYGTLDEFQFKFGAVEHTADIYEWADEVGYDVLVENPTVH